MSDAWMEHHWGDIATLEYGKGLRGYKEVDAEYPVFGTNGQVGWHTEPLCSHPGVIIGRKGAYRGVHFSDKPFWVIDTAFYLAPKVGLDIKWAYYQLLTQDINAMDSGSAIPSTSRDDFYALTVSVPPLAEQKAIAHILGTLDDKIELNRQMNETLEQIARALFKSWFVDFDPVHAKVNGDAPTSMDEATAALFPASFTDSELGPIPAGWSVEPIGIHVLAKKGLSYKGKFLADDGYPLHNLNSVFEGGGYKYDGMKYYVGDYKERHIIKPGDVIVANTEQGFDRLLLGYSAIVPRRYGDWGLYTHHLYRVRTKRKSSLNNLYTSFLLNSVKCHQQVSGYGNGTTVNMLPSDALEKPLVVVPPYEIVEAFSGIVGPIMEKRECNLEESRTLADLRDTLLPKLMSGDLHVPEARKLIKGYEDS